LCPGAISSNVTSANSLDVASATACAYTVTRYNAGSHTGAAYTVTRYNAGSAIAYAYTATRYNAAICDIWPGRN